MVINKSKINREKQYSYCCIRSAYCTLKRNENYIFHNLPRLKFKSTFIVTPIDAPKAESRSTLSFIIRRD